MNGIPVYPHPKNGERPYLAVPEPAFSGLFWGLFWGYLLPDLCVFISATPTPMTQMRLGLLSHSAFCLSEIKVE